MSVGRVVCGGERREEGVGKRVKGKRGKMEETGAIAATRKVTI